MELLPGGDYTIDDVAGRLGASRRSLQRRLQGEDTNFPKQLNHSRESLAKTYLSNTDMTADDIAFLLGYQEIGSPSGRSPHGRDGRSANFPHVAVDDTEISRYGAGLPGKIRRCPPYKA